MLLDVLVCSGSDFRQAAHGGMASASVTVVVGSYLKPCHSLVVALVVAAWFECEGNTKILNFV